MNQHSNINEISRRQTNLSRMRQGTLAKQASNENLPIHKAGTLKVQPEYARKQDFIANYTREKNIRANITQEERLLKQTDKTFVLCVDPETKLPFMVNMGMKQAEFADLDNRPKNAKEFSLLGDGLEKESANSAREDSPDKQFNLSGEINEDVPVNKNTSVLLNSRNYPFYYRVKRDLYVTQQLLQVADAGQSGIEEQNDHAENSKAGRKSSRVRITCFEDNNPTLNWSFRNNSTAESFRRSMLPFYLLKQDKDWQYPRYIEHSNLPQNLCEKTSVNLVVSLGQDIRNNIDGFFRGNNNKQLKLNNAGGANKHGTELTDKSTSLIVENFYLLKTARVLIEKVIELLQDAIAGDTSCLLKRGQRSKNESKWNANKLKQAGGSKIHQNLQAENVLGGVMVLKFRYQEAYVYGDTQLIYFSDIRDCIKQSEDIELVLLGTNQDLMNDQSDNHIQFSVNEQMYAFPPIVNTLHLERELHLSHLLQNQQRLHSGARRRVTNMSQGSGQNPDSPHVIENQMKAKITNFYNNGAQFFWYPPKQLLNQSYLDFKDQQQRNQLSVSQGLSYAKMAHSGNQKFGVNKRIKTKAGWKSKRIGLGSERILKSGNIDERFSIKLDSVNNLLRAIKDMQNSSNTQQIYKYKYFDNSYLIKDFEEKTKKRDYEATEKKREADLMMFAKQAANNYDTSIKPVLNFQLNEGRKNKETSSYNFANESNNHNCAKTTFKDWKFFFLNKEDAKLKTTDTDPKIIAKKKKRNEANQGSFQPLFIQVEAALFLGNIRISEYSYSKPQLFSQNIDFVGEEIYFQKLNEKDGDEDSPNGQREEDLFNYMSFKNLPSNTKLSLQIIVIPQPSISLALNQANYPNREGYIYGQVSFPLFDMNHHLKQGTQKLLAWPLEKFDERYVCMADYYRQKTKTDVDYGFTNNLEITLKLPSFRSEVFYDLCIDLEQFRKNVDMRDQNLKSQNMVGILNDRRESNFHSEMMAANNRVQGAQDDQSVINDGQSQLSGTNAFKKLHHVNEESKQIQKVRVIIQHFPREKERPEYKKEKSLIRQYRHFVPYLAIYVRAVDFTDQNQVAECYSFLESSEQAKKCKAEDALALLDAEFGDERIRLFAVTKLSELSDTFLSLYIPQLVQALKYEVHHKSPLSEFLLERSLQNKRVVGHAFFWSIRAGLYEIRSYERYYLVLERFLMCCGKFKFELYRQDTVNRALMKVHQQCMIVKDINQKKSKKDKTINLAKSINQTLNEQLKEYEFLIKLRQSLVLDEKQSESAPEQVRQVRHTRNSMASQNSLRHPQHAQENEDKMFGNYYVGSRFNIRMIEDCIDQHQKSYKEAEESLKKAGIPVLFCQKEVDWQQESIIFPFKPKKKILEFEDSSVSLSKQVPLMLTARSRQMDDFEDQDEQKSEKIKLIFKLGDDLRQDYLVLQFFRIMDEMWMENDLNMEMMLYKVLETGWQIGFIEFVDNSKVITDIHKWRGWFSGSFEERSMYEYFKWKVYPKIFKGNYESLIKEREGEGGRQTRDNTRSQKDRNNRKEGCDFDDHNEDLLLKSMKLTDKQLKKMHEVYIKSCAGQAVATYLLGIRDRHPGNYMLDQVNGRFFHIDFGRFMGHSKVKYGVTRDREPFIFMREMNYLLMNFPRLYSDFKEDDKNSIKGYVSKKFMNHANGLTADGKRSLDEDENMEESKNEQPSLSQRKLFRVIRFKEEVAQDAQLQRQLERERLAKDPREHDFVCLTEGENFMDEDCEILDGIHHLSNSQTTYRQDKEKLNLTSAEKKINEEAFNDFQVKCCKSFQILRERAYVFINLLQLMIVSDMEELQQDDIKYTQNALMLEMSEEQAQAEFKKKIQDALATWYRHLDNFFHIVQHMKNEK